MRSLIEEFMQTKQNYQSEMQCADTDKYQDT